MNPSKSLLSALLLCAAPAGHAGGSAEETQKLYPKSEQKSFTGPEDYFTGDVKVKMLFPDNETAHYSGAYVTFQAGSRTAWHQHPAGQHMVVTDGTALTGTRDGKILEFHEGESVWCPKDIDHWHGATPEAAMTHLVITGSRDGENVTWKEKVSDEEYLGKRESSPQAEVNLDSLNPKQQALIPIAAFAANGNMPSLKTAMAAGLDAGLTINEVKELHMHLYAYVGFPRALNGLGALMQLVEERKQNGIKDEVGKDAGPMPTDKTSLELGKAVQTELVGQPVTGPLFDFAPMANTLLQDHLFGDLFGRDVLDYQSREIVTLAALASLDGVESQFKSHLNMASNVGVSEEQLSALVVILSERVGKAAGNRAQQALEDSKS